LSLCTHNQLVNCAAKPPTLRGLPYANNFEKSVMNRKRPAGYLIYK